jgi:hypothetical protein
MKYIIIALLFLVSCKGADQKVPAEPLIGTWEYTRTELTDGTPINLEDSMYRNLHNQQVGLRFTFTDDKTFRVTQLDNAGKENQVAEQPYEFPADRKTVILKNSGREDDHFPIIGLSDSLLRINIFYSTKAYLVFRKLK